MENAAHSADVPGIGKYHLVAELARGGMGIVHLATLHGPGGFQKVLVVKELKPELCQDDAYVAMFLDEARLAARLQHRNIVQTLEVGSEGQRHYMAMEFLDGRSLSRIAHRFADRASFPVGAHLRVISEALAGLHYAHDLRDFDGQPMGVVHRDVSPLNVVVTFDGQVKVIDFGIAKSIDSTLETKTGVLKGRIAYMAPEQAWGQPVDRRADVYSAGVMIWEAATGRRLWPGKNEVEILATMLREGPPSPRTVRSDVPADLTAICMKALARDPQDRYPSAAALLEDLEGHLARRPDAMTMRDVGGLVSAVFAEERRRTSAVIDETMSRVRGSHPRSGVMFTLEGSTRGTPSGPSRILPTPGTILGSLQPSPVEEASAATPRPGRLRAWADGKTAVVGGIAAGVTLVLLAVVATWAGGEPRDAGATSRGRVLDVPAARTAHDSFLDVSSEGNDADRNAAAAARWIAAHPVARSLKHASTGAPSAPESPAPTAPSPQPVPAPESAPPVGHAPLRPIITSNPYGTP